jgi:hypothetical protein
MLSRNVQSRNSNISVTRNVNLESRDVSDHASQRDVEDMFFQAANGSVQLLLNVVCLAVHGQSNTNVISREFQQNGELFVMMQSNSNIIVVA